MQKVKNATFTGCAANQKLQKLYCLGSLTSYRSFFSRYCTVSNHQYMAHISNSRKPHGFMKIREKCPLIVCLIDSQYKYFACDATKIPVRIDIHRVLLIKCFCFFMKMPITTNVIFESSLLGNFHYSWLIQVCTLYTVVYQV